MAAGTQFYLVGEGAIEGVRLADAGIVNHRAVTRLARSLFRGGFDTPTP